LIIGQLPMEFTQLYDFGANSAETESLVGDFSQVTEKSTGLRILIVDDESLIRWALAETLTARGCQVAEASDAAAAVRAVSGAAEPFDIVLLDLRLPDSTDLGLLEAIREAAPYGHVILMTAYGTPEIERRARRLGAYDVVDKPFEISDLAALVSSVH
jgi:DNA-binding NtrC family response regulator